MIISLFHHLEEENEDALLTLKDETLFEINEFIFEKGMVSLQDVIEQFNLDDKTTQSHIDTLLSVGLIDFQEENGTETYWGIMEQLQPVLEYWQKILSRQFRP